MAEGFELYHIPQQSRREKLRVVLQDHCNFPQDLSFIPNHDQAPFHGGDFVALSLSSQNTHNGISLPVGLDLQSCGGGSGGDFGRGGVMTHGPYTGYALVLKGSKFLKPTQQLLEGICDVGFGIYGEKLAVDCGLMTDPHPLENLRTCVDGPGWAGVDKRKRSTLISLLDEVYKKYKQYNQQIQAVSTSFETVAGLSNAAPFANLDIKAMLKHFHYLKNAITEQIQCTVKPHEHHISYGNKDFVWSGGSSDGRMAVDNMGFVEHQPVWRLQRGLPKNAVKVLRSWLFDHFLHPYPTDTDKQSLAKQTGLSRNQVSNWFINARVRVWKPMVEEVHTLETRQAHRILSHTQQQETSTLANSFSSHPMSQEPPLKRTRNDIPSDDIYNDQHIMEENKKHLNFYDNLSIHRGNSRASGNPGVPLMLGLRQNNNVYTFSEKFPLNARGSSERFIVGGLNAQNRQLGQEIIGGRFLHDFGG